MEQMEQTANPEQAQAWNGYEGHHWARNQDRWDAVNAGFTEPLLTAAVLVGGDRVLDVGCGAGATTRQAARRVGAGHALGLDLSGPMLERARALARREGLGNVAFAQGDAQVHRFEPGTYDVAISRFGVMFFGDPVAAFTNIAGALRPGGRAAFVCAAEAEGSEWLQAVAGLRDILPIGGFGEPGGPGMFSLADPERTRGILAAAGFVRLGVRHVEAYGVWGRDADEAAAFLLGSGPGHHLLAQVGPAEQERARRTLTDLLRPYERDGALRLRSTAWLVTAERPR